MARLRFRDQVPPSGWWYIQRETRLRIEGESLPDLVQKVIAHRKYKSLETLDTSAVKLEVERQICSRLDDYHCRAEGPEDKWVPVKLASTVVNAENVRSFSQAAFEWLKGGGQTVSREKAEERAKKCQGCPLNWAITGCKCGWLYKLIEKAVPKEKRFSDLGVCMVCECSLPAKVWMPREVVEASNVDRVLRFPQDGSCWQHDEAQDPKG